MRHFRNIVATLEDTDDSYARAMTEAAIEGDVHFYMELETRKLINAQAYFTLLFSQLEAEVNSLCRTLIDHMQAQPDWMERRAWDIIDHREDRLRSLAFLKRVALLTDKGGPVYKRIKDLYEARNKIAHGELLAELPDVTEVTKDIQHIAEQLKGAP